jgi:hypothetical protein
MSSLAWVHIPVIEITDPADAGRILKLSAADVALLLERGIFDTRPRHGGEIENHEVLETPLVRQWSVSAAVVEKDSVFAGLIDHGENGLRSGGLLRYHRASRRVTLYSVPDPIHSLARVAGVTFLGTSRGAYRLKDGAFTRIVYRQPSSSSDAVAGSSEKSCST